MDAVGWAAFTAVVGLWVCSYRRLNEVYKEQTRVLGIVSELAKRDIESGSKWEWRYENYAMIATSRMYWELWKPVEAYFHDAPCVKP